MTTRTDTKSRHWRILRNALQQSTSTDTSISSNGSETTASSIATEFFPLYHGIQADTVMDSPPQENRVWMAYDLPCEGKKTTGKTATRVYVHEKRKEMKRMSIAELLSHQVNQGVDNTGNIRTWPSEQVLLSYLLASNVCSQVQQRDTSGDLLPITCCELGSGMAGLASLGLLACAPVKLQHVLVTDGNPLSVKNVQLCIEENKMQHAMSPDAQSVKISTRLLRWDRSASFQEDLLHQFDLVFASDCLFFEEFHEDLAYTIKNLLRDGSGRCLLLQPSRNGSMERFCVIAKRQGFSIDESRDYDPMIVCKHAEYQQTRPDYVPDVHFPVLLILSYSSLNSS
ncbi:unnamed protein product [Peronospora destructor]|uniref:Calmodulin-lysine N-methyltransferase n=1 Tax=Peronospora destructor TaxID=86335 RepID=A0AAV0U6M5_9STRA|nr:unnamed protein product [Peronospora destructor]